MKSLSNFVLLSAALAACGGTVPLGAVDHGVGPADAGGVSASAWEIQPCEDPSGPVHAYTSSADVQARIAGAWFLCSGGVTWSPLDTAGIEISATEAHYLVESGGTLVRGSPPDHDRDVGIEIGADATYELALRPVDHEGEVAYYVQTSEDGRFLELTERTSGKMARYVRTNPTAP